MYCSVYSYGSPMSGYNSSLGGIYDGMSYSDDSMSVSSGNSSRALSSAKMMEEDGLAEPMGTSSGEEASGVPVAKEVEGSVAVVDD